MIGSTWLRTASRWSTWLVLLLAASWLAPAVAAAPRGFVASFDAQPGADGRMALRSLAALDAAPGARDRELAPGRDWRLRWIDVDGIAIADARVPDPRLALIGSIDPSQPLTLRFADHSRATLVEVRDADGFLRGEVPLDERSRERADAATRRVLARLDARMRPALPKQAAAIAAAEGASRQVRHQLAVQQQVRARRAARCDPALPPERRVPERVAGEPCEAGVATVRAGDRPPSAWAAPARPAVAPEAEVRGKSLPLPPAGRRAQADVTLTGHVRFPAGATPPTSPITLYSWGAPGPGSGYVLTAQPPAFAFSSPVAAGNRVDLEVVPPAPWLGTTVPLGVVAADTYREVTLERGVTVGGQVRFPAGATAPDSGVTVDFIAPYGYRTVQASPPDFAFAAAFAPGTPVDVVVEPPLPFLRRVKSLGAVSGDTSVVLPVDRGVLVTGTVVGPASYQVQVRDVLDGTAPRWLSFGTPSFTVAVPPRGATLEVVASGWMASDPIVPVGGRDLDVTVTMRAAPGAQNVTLTVLDGGGAPLPNARVEAWREGRYASSGLSGADGRARLLLANGAYELRVWPDTEEANEWDWVSTRLYADPAVATPLAVTGAVDATVQVPASHWVSMRVPLPAEKPFPGCGAPAVGRLELLRGGRVVARGVLRDLYPYDGQGHRLITGRGMYTLRLTMPGGVVYASPEFRATPGLSVPLSRVGTAPQRVWTGTLRDPDGAPVANRAVGISDELGIGVWTQCPTATDAQGRFRLPLCEGCVYGFDAVPTSPAQRRVVRIDGPVSGSREQDIALGAPLVFQPLATSGKSRVFGRADAPLKLIFLAEGYVAERETFTDGNGNGLWDGVVWVDVDGDGLYGDGEPYARYGDADAPVAGTDPRVANEPFQDLNGDGVPSFDDRALFEQNVRDYLRGLFSSDQFSAWRHAYQASAVMAYSAQAGMDDGAQVRDTLFDARHEPARGLISIDYGAASVAAAAAEPGYTVVVVMINQPVPYGRVNSFVLASGGMLAGDVNDLVAAHEFGHNPGGLADEYSEFGGVYVGADPGSENSTRFVDRSLVPWGEHVDPALDGRPTRPWFGPSGFFEGSSYQISGAFRPSHASMMRFMDSLLFNQASVDQLAVVHGRVLRGTPGRLAVGGEQQGCGTYRADWDVAALGTTQVRLRGGTHDGPLLAAGAATGTAWVKPSGRDLFLVDAGTGAVLDIEPVPVLRCTQEGKRPPERGTGTPPREAGTPGRDTPVRDRGSDATKRPLRMPSRTR